MTEVIGETDEALAAVAGLPKLVVAVDFDGTLAEIADRPEDATPVPGALRSLATLAALKGTDVALISGRTIWDLRGRAGSIPGVTMVGGHGAEWDEATAPHIELAEVAGEVERLASNYPGARVERKPFSVTVHTRQMDPGKAEELASAVARLGSERGYRSEQGKAVVEIHLTDLTKGTAIDELRRRYQPDAVIYMGDDTTDEEAFEALSATDVGIKVGEGPTRAPWRVATPAEAVEALARLASMRRGVRMTPGQG